MHSCSACWYWSRDNQPIANSAPARQRDRSFGHHVYMRLDGRSAKRRRRWESMSAWMRRHRRLSRFGLWCFRIVTSVFALMTVVALVFWRNRDGAAGAIAGGTLITAVGIFDCWLWGRLDRGDVPARKGG